MASEPTKIGEMDGWTITQPRPGALEATKDGMRSCRVFGREDEDPGVLRTRLFEAMGEADGAASAGGGSVAPAGGGAIAHDATIVVHDDEED